MKNTFPLNFISPFLVLLTIFLSVNLSIAQTDTTLVVQPDTVAQELDAETDAPKEKKEKKKKKNSFKVYAGVNFSSLNLPENIYESSKDLGFQIGASYKSGGFFYWELGARYNNAAYGIELKDTSTTKDGSFAVGQVDIPVTGGINFLSATARLVGLRVFVSAVPSFVISVNDNEANVTKDNINSFGLHAAAGLGVDIAFFFLETGFQYGFSDMWQSVDSSNPSQLFVNLGFRF